jgi:hypothetical protein
VICHMPIMLMDVNYRFIWIEESDTMKMFSKNDVSHLKDTKSQYILETNKRDQHILILDRAK